MNKTILTLLFTAVFLAACSSDDATNVTTPPLQSAGNDFVDPDSGVANDGVYGYGSVATTDIEPGTQEDMVANVGDRVFFGFDSSVLDAEAQATLARQASWLQANPKISVIIEGHCDERGTREYNLALGERRANAVKNYLVSLGISGSRMSTISYGKEYPEVLGSNESAWIKNRRAVTVVSP